MCMMLVYSCRRYADDDFNRARSATSSLLVNAPTLGIALYAQGYRHRWKSSYARARAADDLSVTDVFLK